MPPKGATGGALRAKTTRLPPLPHLRVKHPNVQDAKPCNTVMSAVLNCWASSGYSVEGCANLETALRTCMDEPRPKNVKKNTINYHLSRMYPQMVGPHKRK